MAGAVVAGNVLMGTVVVGDGPVAAFGLVDVEGAVEPGAVDGVTAVEVVVEGGFGMEFEGAVLNAWVA
ncbi:MAG TPA: hypothetical protein VGH31_06895, partial [Acidimicrobiales bacterium]